MSGAGFPSLGPLGKLAFQLRELRAEAHRLANLTELWGFHTLGMLVLQVSVFKFLGLAAEGLELELRAWEPCSEE